MIKIRKEEPSDYRLVEKITKEAFTTWRKEECNEHLLAHNLRKSDIFIPELSLVIEKDGQVIGNIMYAKSYIMDEDKKTEVISFGPVSILPNEQGKGYGSILIKHSLEKAKAMGYRAVIIFGHPEYYPRFGFENASKYGISTQKGKNFDAFMALELYKGALEGVKGRLIENPVYHVDPKELDEFNLLFQDL